MQGHLEQFLRDLPSQVFNISKDEHLNQLSGQPVPELITCTQHNVHYVLIHSM